MDKWLDTRQLKRVFLYTLAFSLAAHAYMYFSLAPTHDGICSLAISEEEITAQIGLGRFMEPVYWLIRGRLSVPWLIGLLSILYLSAGAYIILRLLNIEGRLSAAALCGVFSVSLTLTAANATYISWADMYMLALLLVCAGAWLWELRPKWGFWAAIPLFALSMGFYQAYIDAAIGLGLLLIMKAAAAGEPFSQLWRRAVRYAVSLLGGAALYYILVKLTQGFSGVAMSDGYNGLTQLLHNDLVSLVRLIPGAYFDFAAFFLSPLRAHNTPALLVFRGLLFLTAAALWLRCILVGHIRGLNLAVLLLCAALLPLGLDFVYVLAAGETHDLMTFSFYLVYALPFMAAGTGEEDGARTARLGRGLALALCGCLIFHGVVFANGAYLKKRVEFQASSRYAAVLMTELEQTDGYEPGVTPVALIGSFTGSRFNRDAGAFSLYRNVTGMWYGTAFTYPETFRDYCRVVLGRPVNLLLHPGRLAELAEDEAVTQMPVFPRDGFCRMVDGVMVVRLS